MILHRLYDKLFINDWGAYIHCKMFQKMRFLNRIENIFTWIFENILKNISGGILENWAKRHALYILAPSIKREWVFLLANRSLGVLLGRWLAGLSWSWQRWSINTASSIYHRSMDVWIFGEGRGRFMYNCVQSVIWWEEYHCVCDSSLSFLQNQVSVI